MSTSKLTLSIPKKLLLQAKSYSRKTHRPLSQLVSEYFRTLANPLESNEADKKISKRVLAVTGLAKSSKTEKELLFEALEEKYRK